MKKRITWLLILIICFSCAFSCVVVEASVKSEYLTSDKIKFRSTQSKLISKTSSGNYETDGFTYKINLNGSINSGEAFYIKIDDSVFDLNPTKIVYSLQCDANYSSKTAKFYFSNTNNEECPDESDTVVGYGESNGMGVSIDTTTTDFVVDLTNDKYKNILNNRLNYFYMFNKSSQNPVSNLTLISVKIYYNSSESEYSVNIDNELIEKVNSGESFVLPKSNSSGFVAYKYKDDYYKEGDVISNIEENINITTFSVGKITMQKGASIRIGNVSGIRFFTTIDQNKISVLINMGAVVEKGTIIAPSDIIGDNDFTTDIGKENIDYINVKCLTDNAFYSENTLAGSIVNIKEKNITRDFIGRGYVIVKLGKIEKTFYADYYDNDIKNNMRSINYIAKNYRINNNEEYLSLSDNQKSLIDYWADKDN